MDRLLKLVGFGYLIYALFAIYIIYIIIGKIDIIIGEKAFNEIPLSNYLPLITLGIIALIFIVLILILSYFLHKRIHRTTSRVLSIILSIFPIGTLLGIVTIMLLTRKDIQEQFTS
jgi:hypothetical protein